MSKIKELRKHLKLSQAEFADCIEVSQGAVSHYEKGRRDPEVSTAKLILKLAEQHGFTISLNDIYLTDEAA